MRPWLKICHLQKKKVFLPAIRVLLIITDIIQTVLETSECFLSNTNNNMQIRGNYDWGAGRLIWHLSSKRLNTAPAAIKSSNPLPNKGRRGLFFERRDWCNVSWRVKWGGAFGFWNRLSFNRLVLLLTFFILTSIFFTTTLYMFRLGIIWALIKLVILNLNIKSFLSSN
jgi:hypothetical protein